MHREQDDRDALPELAPPEVSTTASAPGDERALTVPTNQQFALMLAQAKASGTLQDLRQTVAALQAVAEKCNLVFEEMVRLAVFRLQVERDLGAQLAQTVVVGRPRKRCPEGTVSGSSLPDGLSKKQSAAYQKLAAIPDDVYRAYLDKSRRERTVPSSAGARRFASPQPPARPRPARRWRSAPPTLSAAALDAISRVMTPDVVVGDAGIAARRRLRVDEPRLLDALRGDVLVADCPDPAALLPALLRLHARGRFRQVIVAVPAEVWADWFAVLEATGVSCCFLRGESGDGIGRAVLHLGAGAAGFRIAMTSVGFVLHA